MFAGNQDAALLHDVCGKTASISCSQYSIQTRVFQYRRASFLVALHSGSLTGQQAQLAVCLTARDAKEAELLNAVQGCPGTDVLNAVA